MRIRKNFVALISIVLCVAVALCIGIPLIKKANNKRIIEQYTSENLELYSELDVISDCAVIDETTYTLAGIKEAVKSGADTVTLDLCFDPDGNPVVTDNYENINNSTLKAKDVFELICKDGYKDTKINFRLRQLVTLSALNSLIAEYDVAKRVIISGIDSNRYSLLSGTDTPAKVYFDYIPVGDAVADTDAISELIAEYNLGGVIIELDKITQELVDALSQQGISYTISDVESETDMYRVMSYGAYSIETDSPAQLIKAHNSWREITIKRLDSSIMDELNK